MEPTAPTALVDESYLVVDQAEKIAGKEEVVATE
jgi:hypothetical protein